MPYPIATTMPAAAIEGSRLVSADGRILPLSATALRVTAGGGLARTCLRQRFRNLHDEALTVTYLLPLPADGAVSAFAFTIGDRRIQGEVDKRAVARERFERALVSGHTAALLEQDRSSLFRQEIGNVPPGAEILVELEVDQPLAWRTDGNAWEYRFPTTVAPRYQGAPGRVDDAARQAVDVADAPLPATLELQLAITDPIPDGTQPESPSDRLHCSPHTDETLQVAFADGRRRLDRDVVVRWATGEPGVGVALDCVRTQLRDGSDEAFGLLTLVPPRLAQPPVPRDLVLLLDTSGSMTGAPLDQALAVARALIDALGSRDRLRMVEFSNSAREWLPEPVYATRENLELARMWLDTLRARGGTEMLSGVRQALEPLRDDAQTQVVLLTDGLIGFENEITAHLVRSLPSRSRFHVLGVGDSANRALTRAAARASRGTEAVVGIDDTPQRAAEHLVQALAQPVVVDLEIDGTAVRERAPQALPDLFAAAPARIALLLEPDGGTLRVRGRTAAGPFVRELAVEPAPRDGGRRELATLFARERVEDLETMRAAASLSSGDADREIERIGLAFQIATRLTSWIAVTDNPTIDPNAPARRETMPHELPHGMAVEGLGLRACSARDPFETAMCLDVDIDLDDELAPEAPQSSQRSIPVSKLGDLASRMAGLFGGRSPEWRVRLVQLADGHLVLEFHNRGRRRCRWQLPQQVELRTLDGRVVAADVETGTSTSTGRIAAGAMARLVLTLPAGLDAEVAPEAVRLPGGEWLAIA